MSQWADAERVLSREASAQPGRWSTEITPWLRAVMDAITNDLIEKIVMFFSSQMGKTEVILNALGYYMDEDPGPMMVVQPTGLLVEDFSRNRFSTMLRDTPALQGLVPSGPRDPHNKMDYKKFPGGHVSIAGSHSPASLAARPIRILLCDEIDRYPLSAGNEGDPVLLATKRTTTFFNRKIILSSTGTIKGASRIETEYENSDRRRYKVPCPECDHRQALVWKHLKWKRGPKGEHLPKTAYYECEACAFEIQESHKTEMVDAGSWEAERPTEGVAGFWINELYSAFRSWADIVKNFLEVKDFPEQLKVFVNTTLAETWEERGDAPAWELLFARRESYQQGIVPAGGAVLVLGVDVQGDRIEAEVVAYGKKLESWSVDYVVIPGDPQGKKKNDIWQTLTDLVNAQYRTESGQMLSILMVAIDSGYATTEVYQWGRKLGAKRVMCIKGMDTVNSILGRPKLMDISAGGRTIKRGISLWGVGVNIVKSELYANLRLEPSDPSPPGYCHFPSDRDEEFFKQLTAEELRRRKTKKGFSVFEYVKARERNEALDCRVYARAAAERLGISRLTDEDWAKLLDTAPAPGPGRKRRTISKGIDL